MSIFSDIAKQMLSQNDGKSAGLEPVAAVGDQPLDEKKLVDYVKEKLESVKNSNSRTTMEQIYLTNVAYLLGFDGVYYDTNYRQFKNNDPKRRISRNRFKVNKILPTIQNRLARLTQSPPRFDVRPNSNSSEDKDCSRLGLEIIKDVFDRQRLNEKIQDLLMAAMQGGHSYVQVLWDSTLGNPMYDPETNEFTGYEGDIRLEVLNCLELFPDPLAKSITDAQFLIKAKVRKLDYFREKYPERGSLVKEETPWLLSSIYDLKTNAMSSVGIQDSKAQDQTKNAAIEVVYYEKRSKEHPNGRMVVTANGVLLEDKELPIGEFDIVKFDDIMIGSRYNAEAVITHLRPIQDQYNITRTKCADWIKKMLAGKYLAAKGHGLGQESLTNDSGEVVEYSPVPNAAPPTVMNIPMIPQYVYKDLETLDKEFDFVSGINEISRGVLPSASIPAAGMAFLQEQDQSRIGVQTSRNEIGFSKVGTYALKYVGKYYKMPRLLKVAGDGLSYTVKEFVGADINNNFDVIVINGSTVPQSKVLRRQDIITTFQMGLLGDPADPKLRAKVLSMLEYGDTAEMWKGQALDEAQVKKVISYIEENDQEKLSGCLNDFDNQSFHLEKMNEYRKSDKFDQLDDEKQSLFMWVMNWRLQSLVNTTNPELQQQQVMAELMMNNLNSQQAQNPLVQQMQNIKPVIGADGSIQNAPGGAAQAKQGQPPQNMMPPISPGMGGASAPPGPEQPRQL